MKKKLLMVACCTCILALLGGAAFLWREKVLSAGSANKDAIAETLSGSRPVVLEKVASTTHVKDRSFPGVVKAIEKTQLSFRIHGPLVEVNVKPGDSVKAGQVLMRVDPRDFEDKIQVLEAQLAGMSAQYIKAEQDLERAKTLFSQGVIPPATRDADQSAYDASAASVKDVKAQLQIARHQLEDTSLIAPYDGIITEKCVENHEMIAVGQVVLGMHDLSRLKIAVEVPENEIALHQVQRSETAKIQFPSVQGRDYAAVLKEWNTSADPVTRTYAVVFVMEAPKDVSIFPGMTAQAKWASERSPAPVVAIPARSISADTQGKSFVWVFNPQSSKAQKRFVETGKLINSSQTQILTGVGPGELIVTEGADFITETMELLPLNSDTNGTSSLLTRSQP